MRLALEFTGEVQIDIGLFITRKAQKGLERDVDAVALKRCLAIRTIFGRQVNADNFLVVDEFAVLAGFTIVMRRQRVDLGDAVHLG